MIQAKYCTLEHAFFWSSGKIVRAWGALFCCWMGSTTPPPQLGAPRSIPDWNEGKGLHLLEHVVI